MSEDICKMEWPFPAQADPQWGQEVQLPSVQQVICSESSFEDALPHSHWGDTAQVHTVQLFMQPGFQPQNAYQEAHWGKSMQLFV